MLCLIDTSAQVHDELTARHQWADEMRRAREAVQPRPERTRASWWSLVQASLARLRATAAGTGSWDRPDA